jgi:hypothetical protein
VAVGAGAPAPLLDAAHVEDERLAGRDDDLARGNAMLVAALEQLPLEHDGRPGAPVGDDELLDDRGAGALGDGEPRAAQIVGRPLDGVAVPDREEREGAAGQPLAQVQVEELHEPHLLRVSAGPR